jgi:hypothetical protein
MYLSQLRWLEGFAADGRWHVVGGEPRALVVDGPALARARRTANTLRREHGGALAALVGDAEAWFAGVDEVLKHLGDRLHGGRGDELGERAPPRLRAAAGALAAAHPRLRPLIRAATSAWLLRPDVLGAALAWMKKRAEALSRLVDGAAPGDLRRVLELACLAGESAAGVDALIALLLADVDHPHHSVGRIGNLLRRLRNAEASAAPAPGRTSVSVLRWLDGLLEREPGDRARALALLAALDLARALAPWRTWEAEHGARIARAEALVARGIDRVAKMEDLGRLLASIERARAALPPTIGVGEVLFDLAVLAEARHQPFHAALLGLLAALPADASGLLAARLLDHVAEVAKRGEDDQRATWLWQGLARELNAGASPRILGPWSEVVDGNPRPWLEDDLLGELRGRADVGRFAAGLARLARERPVSARQARRLRSALAGGLDLEEAAALILALEPLAVDPSHHMVRAALALVGHDTTALAGTLNLMGTRCAELKAREEEALAALCERSAATGLAWLLRGLLDREGPRLAELAQLAALVPRRAWPTLDSLSARPRWIGKYPPALAEALARLASVDPAGEDTARRRLATDLPDRAALEREVAALRARPSSGEREARRLRNLERRMAAPWMPSPARLARLAARLGAAALAVGGARLVAAFTAAAQARVLAGLGLESWPGPPPDHKQWSLLLALLDLPPADRALAARLLRARTGPPPWDLRDDPANRGFLARVRALFVDPTPWLDDAPRVVTAGDGRSLELAFSSDPLEIFAMGAHFATCLSPDGGNFFSVITNAADVNKRVLYARRDGKVVGRCLLALTDAGRVLTFHPYAHDNDIGFDALVRDFAADLATRMASAVAPAGRVTTLLGRDWYDDGAQDLVGRYQALSRPEVGRALEEVAPSALVALLEATLAHPLDDITLPLVVALPALQSRPELIEPLAPRLLALRTLPDHTLLTAGGLAMQHGDLALADRLLAGPAERNGFQHSVWFLGRVLARTRPSFMLARLRQTRPRHVRRLEDERGDRLAVAALALETLRRPRQAAAFYRRAIADEPWLAGELEPRLEAIEGAEG